MPTWTTPSAIHSKCGEHVLYPATDAIDESTSSYWRHLSVCFHWIIFDLSQTYTVSKIRLYQASLSTKRWGKAAGLDVFVSDDPASWGVAVWTGVLNALGWQESVAFNKDGRYVKLVSKDDADTQQMYEFDAYCSATGYVPTHHPSGRGGGVGESIQGGIAR